MGWVGLRDLRMVWVLWVWVMGEESVTIVRGVGGVVDIWGWKWGFGGFEVGRIEG